MEGDTVVITLNRRKGDNIYTLVSTKDLEELLKYDVSWIAGWRKTSNSFYAQCSEYQGIVDGKPKYKTVMLHSFVMGTGSGRKSVVDHLNHDTLDNRRDNLVLKTMSTNAMNRQGANVNNKSTGRRNVSYLKSQNKYAVQFCVKGKRYRWMFENLNEAVEFSIEKRKELYG